MSALILTLNPLVSASLPSKINILFQTANVYAAIYLAATTYGIVNDLFATGDSIPYFARGHNPGAIFVNTYNRFANSFVWGHIATGGLAHIAASIFAVTSLSLNCFKYQQLDILAPTVIMGAALIATVVDLRMRLKKWNELGDASNPHKSEAVKDAVEYFDSLNGLYDYQKIGIKTDEQKYLWLLCSNRNLNGYIAMPTFGVLGLILYTSSRIKGFNPNLLDISPIAQIAIPAAIVAGLLCSDYYVRNHTRTWEGEELPEQFTK